MKCYSDIAFISGTNVFRVEIRLSCGTSGSWAHSCTFKQALMCSSNSKPTLADRNNLRCTYSHCLPISITQEYSLALLWKTFSSVSLFFKGSLQGSVCFPETFPNWEWRNVKEVGWGSHWVQHLAVSSGSFSLALCFSLLTDQIGIYWEIGGGPTATSRAQAGGSHLGEFLSQRAPNLGRSP